REWLHRVIVSSSLEGCHLVVQGVADANDHNGKAGIATAKLFTDSDAVLSERAALQKNGVVVDHTQARHCDFAVWGFSYIKSQRFKCSPKLRTYRRFFCN